MILIRQYDVEEISNLLSECGILPVEMIKALLAKRGKNEEQTERIINQMIKRRLMWYDETQYYVRLNKPITTAYLNQGQIKSLWLLIDLLDNIGEYFVQQDSPHTMTFRNTNDDEENQFYDVFYVPYNSENISCYTINNAKLNGASNKVMIILDNESQIPKLNLTDRFHVVSYVTVDAHGTVNYFGGSENEE